jgi:ubiquinone/menaquinone biosynthesis C-methylase UbiE
MERFHPARIIGLDVAPAMVEHAKARLRRDRVDTSNWSFEVYDGVTMPFADQSIDHVYSVASLQHVPKLYVYNLFSEMVRVLRDGYAAFQLLSFGFLPKHHRPFMEEVTQQLRGEQGHWHHFYSRDELLHVLPAIGARDVSVNEIDGNLWTVFRRA